MPSRAVFIMLDDTMSTPDPSTSTRIAAAPCDAGAPLDAAALQRLRELDPDGGNQVVQRVMQAFELSLTRLMAQAVDAHRDGDMAAIRHVAHTLKSSSASVGALGLSRRCSEIENLLRAGRHDGLGQLLQSMQDEGLRVLSTVRGLLQG